MSVEFELCEQVANAINADQSGYGYTVNASASYVVDFELDELSPSTPRVDVTPMTLANGYNGDGLSDRNTFGDFWTILVVVNAAGITSSDNAKIASLVTLVRQIHKRIARYDRDNGFSMGWTGQRNLDPIFNREKMKTDGRFLSISEFVFYDKSQKF